MSTSSGIGNGNGHRNCHRRPNRQHNLAGTEIAAGMAMIRLPAGRPRDILFVDNETLVCQNVDVFLQGDVSVIHEAKCAAKALAPFEPDKAVASKQRSPYTLMSAKVKPIPNRLGPLALICLLLAGGCKPKAPPVSTTVPSLAPVHFQTPFQNESEFIVDAIVSDLAEQMFYAKFHRLPDRRYFSVNSREKLNSSWDEPMYELHVRLDPKQRDMKMELVINGPIWSPAVYQNVASELARSVGLSGGSPQAPEDTSFLSAFTNNTAETIEQQNQDLSAVLEEDFGNPVLHEKAALLLGAFMLRDHSGHFYEIRSPLCRMTTHLTMATFLSGTNNYGLNGQMAEAILLTLMGDQAAALDQLNAISTDESAALPMIRALKARITGDYHLLALTDHLTRIESVARFYAVSDSISPPVAWTNLDAAQQQTIDFVRLANRGGYSVEMGNQLVALSIPLELQELASVFALSHHKNLASSGLTTALNEMPERCFITETDGTVHVRIIGWGQWADFFQRHLCHTIQHNFGFLQNSLDVPDDAKEFAAACSRKFGGLRLYPFVERTISRDRETYYTAVDGGFKVTMATPQLVPADCWNLLYESVDFATLILTNADAERSQWYNHSPLPGTAYDLPARFQEPGFYLHTNLIARLEHLHQLAPYDPIVATRIFEVEYTNHPTYDQAVALFGPVLPYSERAQKTVAGTVSDQPDRYEKLMLQVAASDPACYYSLGNYFLEHTNEDKAAYYTDKACELDPDSVRVSNHAVGRVQYYLNKGQIDKAREIADFAGDVYSSCGLQSKAIFLESTSNYDEAFEWYAKVAARYDEPGPLLAFCARYRAQTGDLRFESERQKGLSRLFTNGIENVTFNNFHSRPTDGVQIQGENGRLRSAGLLEGDVIVAVDGVRVHNFQQYIYGRDLKNTPELDLIVWRGRSYREFKPKVPGHLFGVDLGDYSSQWPR